MFVEIKESDELLKLQEQTGMPISELVNSLLEIQLDPYKKNQFIAAELDKLFARYLENQKLMKIQKQTGKTISELVNSLLRIQLDPSIKKHIAAEQDKLFSMYLEKSKGIDR